MISIPPYIGGPADKSRISLDSVKNFECWFVRKVGNFRENAIIGWSNGYLGRDWLKGGVVPSTLPNMINHVSCIKKIAQDETSSVVNINVMKIYQFTRYLKMHDILSPDMVLDRHGNILRNLLFLFSEICCRLIFLIINIFRQAVYIYVHCTYMYTICLCVWKQICCCLIFSIINKFRQAVYMYINKYIYICYEWSKRTKFLLAVIYGSACQHSIRSKTFKKNHFSPKNYFLWLKKIFLKCQIGYIQIDLS